MYKEVDIKMPESKRKESIYITVGNTLNNEERPFKLNTTISNRLNYFYDPNDLSNIEGNYRRKILKIETNTSMDNNGNNDYMDNNDSNVKTQHNTHNIPFITNIPLKKTKISNNI